MMRTLLFLCILVFAGGVMAQSPMLTRLFNDGTRSANAGDFEQAATSYRTALTAALNENRAAGYLAKLHFNLGVCHYRLQKADDAVSELGKAVKLSRGTYQRAYYALGMAEFERKNWPNARLAFLAALKLNEADGEAWFDLAIVYLAERDLENAGQAFRNSITYKSVDSALGHNNIGVIMAMNNDLAAAENEFAAALAGSGGRLIEARRNLGLCRKLAMQRMDLVGRMEFSIAGRNFESLL